MPQWWRSSQTVAFCGSFFRVHPTRTRDELLNFAVDGKI